MFNFSQPKKQTAGFTLVEMIVSLGLFSVVITISVGALLSLIATNERRQDEQSVMTNLSFAVDAMAREIRTGSAYYCESRPNLSAGGNENLFDSDLDLDRFGTSTQDCATGRGTSGKYHGLSFKEGGDSVTGALAQRLLYYFIEDEGKIYRRIGDKAAQVVTSDGIFIKNLEFYVNHSAGIDGSGSDDKQAVVTIKIEAQEASSTAAKTYKMQTTVTQRALDI